MVASIGEATGRSWGVLYAPDEEPAWMKRHTRSKA
jgi:hypothetical protein